MNLYQEHILDHYHNPVHWGALNERTHHCEVKNPTCGDVLRFDLQIDGEVVKEIAWTGEGCAISLASASLLSETVIGKTKNELMAIGPNDVLALLSLSLSPARLKCGILSLEALHCALISKDK